MSPLAHVQANENKLEKVGPTFSSSVRDFGGMFYPSKSKPLFDSFVLRIVLW